MTASIWLTENFQHQHAT